MLVTATDTRLAPETRRSSRVRQAPAASSAPLDPVQRRAPAASTGMRRSTSSSSTGSAASGSGEGKARSKASAIAHERAAGGGGSHRGTVPRRKRERDTADDVVVAGLGMRTLYMPVEVDLVGARCEQAGSVGATAAGPPAAALPSLLAHLSLSRSFPPPTIELDRAAHSFAFAHPPPPPAPTYRLLHPFHHQQPLAAQTPKRASVGPHPHLLERTKKRKLFHRFFRSESLLAGPAAPAPPPTLGLGPGLALPRSQPPDASKKQPTWWPSVSRSMGEGRESRLGPAECEWVGEGDNWLSRLQLRFGGTPAGGSREGTGPDSDEREIAGKDSDERAGVGPRTRSGGVVASNGGKSRRNRSASSPATFTPTDYHLHHHPQSVPGAPPLKQHLLAVLRMRLSEGGSTSRGGEAGLRFKKWVVWNSWMKRTNAASDDESDLVEGSDVSDDLEHERAADHLPVDWQDSALHSAHAGGSPSTAGLPLVLDAASIGAPAPSHAHSHPMELDHPIPPPRPTSPNHLPLDAAPPADSLQLQEDLSFALGVDSHAEGSSRGAKILQAPLPVRPSARRAHSLPGGAVVTLAKLPLSSSGATPNAEPREQDRRSRRDDGRATGPIACEA